MATHVPAVDTPVPADRVLEDLGTTAQRLVRQLPGHRVPRQALKPATSAPPVDQIAGLDDPTASTERSGSSRCPVTFRPSSSSRQIVVRPGQAKAVVGLASSTLRSPGWIARKPPSSGDLDPQPQRRLRSCRSDPWLTLLRGRPLERAPRPYRSSRFYGPVATLYLDHMSGAGAIIGLGTRAVPQRRSDGWRRRSRGVFE